MAGHEHDLTDPPTGKQATSNNLNNSNTFYKMTEGYGFTMNLHAPLHEELARGKRKHDEIRENALHVLNLHLLKEEEHKNKRARKLELDEIAAKKKIEEENFAHAQKVAAAQAEIAAAQAQTEKLKNAAAEAEAAKQRTAQAHAETEKLKKAAAEAEAAKQRAAAARAETEKLKSQSAPKPEAYNIKKIEEIQLQQIVTGLRKMNQDQKQQVKILVNVDVPGSILKEKLEVDIEKLSPTTMSKIHDLVERLFPEIVHPKTGGVPSTASSTDKAEGKKPEPSTARAASPQRTSPRNIKNLNVNIPAGGIPFSAIPPHMNATNPANTGTMGAGSEAPESPRLINQKLRSAMNRISQHPDADKWLEIHATLKDFRELVKDQMEANPALKKVLNELRREIVKRLNQVSENQAGNRTAANSIRTALRTSLQENCGAEEDIKIVDIDPSMFFVRERAAPIPKGTMSADKLPLSFVYLMHMLAKAAVKKYVEECSASPEKADKIGLMVTGVFSTDEFCWRGQSFIDMLLAKFRKDCPVLFGIRGNEKTEQGRARLGWRRNKKTGVWVDETEHNNRMTGLAAGFSSISLRDFSRAKAANPLTPPNWWKAMSAIVETPEELTSNTQFIVLRWMIANWEKRIVRHFGEKSMVSLATSVHIFPSKAPEMTPAVGSLQALAATLMKEAGLNPEDPIGKADGPFSPTWGPLLTPMSGVIFGPLKTPLMWSFPGAQN